MGGVEAREENFPPQRRAHDTQPPLTNMLTMLCKLLSDAAKRTLRRALAAVARRSSLQEAIPGLPDHLVVAHILRSEYFDDPADLARLPAVSRAMRDAVAATGLRFEELGEVEAVTLGCLRAVQHLRRGGCLSREEYLRRAAARADSSRVEGVARERHTVGRVHVLAAALGGHLDVLLWALANGCPWDASTCTFAAKDGHLKVLQWARVNGCPWDGGTCAGAAQRGHLEVLQWARANGCPWGGLQQSWEIGTCSGAAQGGHLEVLQWARENGCPWDWKTCAFAASCGQLEVQWARANGCPWDGYTLIYARRGSHLELLNWAIASGCPE